MKIKKPMLKSVRSPLDQEMDDSLNNGMNHTDTENIMPSKRTKKGMPSQQTINDQGILKTLRVPRHVIDAATKVVEDRVKAAIKAGIPEAQARRGISERSVLVEFVEQGAERFE